MIKIQYIKELSLKKLLKKGMKEDKSRGEMNIHRVQEWINLWRYYDTSWSQHITVDGEFGPQTDKVIRMFQAAHNLKIDGLVGDKTFAKLTEPMYKAFSYIEGASLRDLVIAYAKQQLSSSPRELYNENLGPWVRAYMDGLEGKPWAWCMGFTQTVLDQAFTSLGMQFISIMPKTYSCDVVGEYGKANNRLRTYADVRATPSLVKPGDVFLVYSRPGDWTHTGIITNVEDGFFHTIEGNTNDEGSREGFEVCQRIRNYQTNKLEVFSLGD